MQKRRTHISIPYDIDDDIKQYACRHGISYSEAVFQLVSLGLDNIETTKAINKNNALLDKIYSKAFYSTALLEQIYSDFEWDKITNPKYSKALNKFKEKFNKYTFDD